MKKSTVKNLIAMTLTALLALGSISCVFADDTWVCSSCGNEASGNFCSNCGTAYGAAGAVEKMTDLKSVKAGDVVTFGSYEQDNDLSNGREEIEWRVLAAEDNRVLLISKYALDCQPYNSTDTAVTWETCTLRTWLNSTFLDNAFSDAEQELIETVTVTADKNPEYSTDPGNDTQDRVFLLSITEVNEYFTSDDDRMCEATAYAVAQGAYTNSTYEVDSSALCWWWLRSPGFLSNIAAGVFNDGSVFDFGLVVNRDYGAIRPALWINLES